MIRVFIIACYIRLLSQLVWKFFEYEGLYAIGLACFELAALALVLFLPDKKPTKWQSSQLMFFALCALWDFYKYLFLDPYGMYVFDYINTAVSLLVAFLLRNYDYRNIDKGFKRGR